MSVRKYIIDVIDYGASGTHPDIDYCSAETDKSLDEVLEIFEKAVIAYNKEEDPDCLIEYVQDKMGKQGIKLYKLVPNATVKVAVLAPNGISISK